MSDTPTTPTTPPSPNPDYITLGELIQGLQKLQDRFGLTEDTPVMVDFSNPEPLVDLVVLHPASWGSEPSKPQVMLIPALTFP